MNVSVAANDNLRGYFQSEMYGAGVQRILVLAVVDCTAGGGGGGSLLRSLIYLVRKVM